MTRVERWITTVAVIGLAGCGNGDREPAPAPDPGTGDAAATAPAAASQAPWLREEAASRGVDFVHVSGHQEGVYLIPEITVGGAALFDMDGDDDLDLYLVQSGHLGRGPDDVHANRLYRNRGDGTFEDVTAGSGADDRGYGCGAATGDYDNDGDLDLYVTNVGPNTLLRNDGTGRFTDVTVEAGVGDDGFGSSSAFVDIDHDGDLDLMVLNYLIWSIDRERDCKNDIGQPDYCAPVAYNAPAVDVLYRNDGDGTMTDITAESGIGAVPGTGLGIVCGDFDGDGLTDIFVANDGYEDRLWINLGDGHFEDRAMLAGCAVDLDGHPKAGMGVDATDVDDDGDLDLIVCNLAKESDSFFENRGTWFEDGTARRGLGSHSRVHTRFGMAWIDFDNDGHLDLFQANGRVTRAAGASSGADPYAETNLLMAGHADGTWRPVEPAGGTATPLVATSRAAAFGDLDGDGGVDIVVVNRDGPVHVLMNVAPDRGHWLSVRVVTEHGRDALGAVVSGRVGARRVTRPVRTTYSYCAANDARVHLGLGDADRVEEVRVRWPDGTLEDFGSFECDQAVTLVRGSGRRVDAPPGR